MGQLRTSVRENWPFYAMGAPVVLVVLTIFRGLSWQWWGILTASPAQPPIITAPGPAPAAAARQVAPAGAGAPNAAAAAPAPGAKRPLPPTNDPPPKNATDSLGVTYDAQGVAVTGIDADPNGVYNVPPGRQVRIGGPSGPLYDVNPDGRLTPATRVKDFP